jgi:hypothetical protein
MRKIRKGIKGDKRKARKRIEGIGRSNKEEEWWKKKWSVEEWQWKRWEGENGNENLKNAVDMRSNYTEMKKNVVEEKQLEENMRLEFKK